MRPNAHRGERLTANGHSRRPELPQMPDLGAIPQLRKCAFTQLADPLPRHTEHHADLFERACVLGGVEAVVQRKDAPLTGCEVAAEEAVEEVLAQHLVGMRLDLAALADRESLAQRGRA